MARSPRTREIEAEGPLELAEYWPNKENMRVPGQRGQGETLFWSPHIDTLQHMLYTPYTCTYALKNKEVQLIASFFDLITVPTTSLKVFFIHSLSLKGYNSSGWQKDTESQSRVGKGTRRCILKVQRVQWRRGQKGRKNRELFFFCEELSLNAVVLMNLQHVESREQALIEMDVVML